MDVRRGTAPIPCALLLIVVGLWACGDSSGPSAPGSWQARSPLQTPRVDFGTALLGGQLYAIGGFSGSTLSSVEVYDDAANTWTTRASMPTPRRDLVVAAVGSKLYAIGGASYSSPNATTHIAATEEYDPSANTWTTKADIPVTFVGATTERMQYVGGAAAGGLVYVFVLENVTCGNTRTFAFDPAANTWITNLAPPPFGGRYAAAASNDRIYVLVTSPPACYSGPDPVNTLAEYNPAADAWVILPSLPRGRSLSALAALGGKLYAIGGIVEPDTLGQSIPTAIVHQFDTATRTWSAVASMPTARASLAAAAVGARILALGGHDRNVPLAVVEALTMP